MRTVVWSTCVIVFATMWCLGFKTGWAALDAAWWSGSALANHWLCCRMAGKGA